MISLADWSVLSGGNWIAASRGWAPFPKCALGTANQCWHSNGAAASDPTISPWSIRQVTAPGAANGNTAASVRGRVVFISYQHPWTHLPARIHRLSSSPKPPNVSLRHPSATLSLQKQPSLPTQPRLATNIQNGSHQGGELLPLLWPRPLFGPTIGFTRTPPEATTSITRLVFQHSRARDNCVLFG
jgi:hypothetical protein